MTTNDNIEQLALLRAQADRSLRLILRRTASLAQTSGGSWNANRPPEDFWRVPPVAPSGAPTMPMPETVFPDNERRLRAMAKEIKRLITEDKRRGLAV